MQGASASSLDGALTKKPRLFVRSTESSAPHSKKTHKIVCVSHGSNYCSRVKIAWPSGKLGAVVSSIIVDGATLAVSLLDKQVLRAQAPSHNRVTTFFPLD